MGDHFTTVPATAAPPAIPVAPSSIASPTSLRSRTRWGSSGLSSPAALAVGPHALAAATRMPERVIRAACNVGAAPYDASDLDWFEGMDPENVKEFGWALEGEETLVRELEKEAVEKLSRLDEDPATLLGEFQLSEADQTVLEDEIVRERMRKSFREALASGVWGWVDDDLAFVKPWGFEVEEIRVPVQVRYGGRRAGARRPRGMAGAPCPERDRDRRPRGRAPVYARRAS